MRGRIARAAFDLIAERGHSAFRTAAVADRAGVSQGAQVHHFATKDGLTLAAVEYAFAHASARTEEVIAEGLAASDDPISLMLNDFRLFFFNDDFWVSLDIAINGSKTPALKDGIREIVPRYRLAVYQRWVSLLHDAGWSEDDAGEIVRMSAALVAGLSIRTIFDDVDRYLESTLAKWRRIVDATWPKAV